MPTPSEQFSQTLQNLQHSPEQLANFLAFSARVYKHIFLNQVLLFAQNPEATFVAEKEVWHRLKRTCMDSFLTGIRFDKDGSAAAIELYDISQTIGNDKEFAAVIEQQVWRITEEDRKPLEEYFNAASNLLFPLPVSNHLFAKASAAAVSAAKKSKTEASLTREIAKTVVASRCKIEYNFSSELSYLSKMKPPDFQKALQAGIEAAKQTLTELQKILIEVRSHQYEQDERTELPSARQISRDDPQLSPRMESGMGTDRDSERTISDSAREAERTIQGNRADNMQRNQSTIDSPERRGHTGSDSVGTSGADAGTGADDSGTDRLSGTGIPDVGGERADGFGYLALLNHVVAVAGFDGTFRMFGRENGLFFRPISSPFRTIRLEQQTDAQLQKFVDNNVRSVSGEPSPETELRIYSSKILTEALGGRPEFIEEFRKIPTTEEKVKRLKTHLQNSGSTVQYRGFSFFMDCSSKGMTLRSMSETIPYQQNLSWKELAQAYTERILTGQFREMQENIITLPSFDEPEESRLSRNFSSFEVTADHYNTELLMKELMQKVVCEGDHRENGKSDIAAFFEEHTDVIERAGFLKSRYPFWERIHFSDGHTFWVEASGHRGLSVTYRYPDLSFDITFYVEWTKLAEETAKVMEDGAYFEPEEKSVIPEKSLETKPVSKVNYQIPLATAEYGGAKEKYRRNVTAIKLLQKLRKENRTASPDEQAVLATYVGWGGVSFAFDPNRADWKTEYEELRALLSPEEYKAARASTLTAYYTEPTLIRAIWEGVRSLGFDGGKVLEPSAGIGNFIGTMPQSLSCDVTAVEIDPLSGEILRHLYPQTSVQVMGFEQTKLSDDSFDLSIGNVPFGDFSVFDERYRSEKFRIHDYFFAKALDKTRAGGLIVFITSSGTMDKANSSVRRYLAQRAELLGAIRLPNNAFQKIAGTEVTSDILILQKRPQALDISPDWTQLGKLGEIPINQYFVDHPEHILGNLQMISGPFGMESACVAKPEINLAKAVKTVLTNLVVAFPYYNEGKLKKEPFFPSEQAEISEILPAPLGVKKFRYAVVNGALYYREDGDLKLETITGKKRERIVGMCEIRVAVREIIAIQMQEGYSESELKGAQTHLNQIYDEFVKKHGYLNESANIRAFDEDSDAPLLAALEQIDSESKTITKEAIFYKATIRPKQEFHISSPEDALIVCLNTKNRVDLEYINALCAPLGIDPLTELVSKNLLYKNPATEHWEQESEYLSGNVKDKLTFARIHAAENPEYQRNVTALEAVQPKPLDFSQIDFQMGSIWIPQRYYEQFTYELLRTPNRYQGNEKGKIAFLYDATSSRWTIYNKTLDNSILSDSTYGTKRKSAYELIEEALNLNPPTVTDTTIVDGKEKRITNVKETANARIKQEQIKQAFHDWILADPDRIRELAAIYNERFNKFVTRKYDGSPLSFDGMAADITLNPHQKDAVARIVQGDSCLIAHPVGAGKTYTLIAGAMKLRQTGTVQKPVFVVPNHLTMQWGADFIKLYPNANILVASKSDFATDNRKRFLAKMTTGDYDAVILAHSQFGKIPMSDEYQQKSINEQLEELEDALYELSGDEDAYYTIKTIERNKKQLEEKLLAMTTGQKKDNVLTFEEMGIDQIFVDESHYFKNCFVNTKISGVSGITVAPAAKSLDMLMKCHYLDEKREGKGSVFATGTPISNSMSVRP